jgi:hypothetical protein
VLCRSVDEVPRELLAVLLELDELVELVVALGETVFDAVCGAVTLGVNP